MAPSLKNARSFLFKLIHLEPSQRLPKSKVAKSDQVPIISSARRTNVDPPSYEVPIPPTSRASHHRPIDSSEQLLEQVIDSSLRRLKARSNSDCASSISSSTHLPSVAPKIRNLSSAQQEQGNLRRHEEVESLTERSIQRHYNCSQHNRRAPHDRPSRRTCSVHRHLKAGTSPRSNLHRKSAPRLADPNRSSQSRRERELLTAKKSLPILTKYGKPTQRINNSLC